MTKWIEIVDVDGKVSFININNILSVDSLPDGCYITLPFKSIKTTIPAQTIMARIVSSEAANIILYELTITERELVK